MPPGQTEWRYKNDAGGEPALQRIKKSDGLTINQYFRKDFMSKTKQEKCQCAPGLDIEGLKAGILSAVQEQQQACAALIQQRDAAIKKRDDLISEGEANVFKITELETEGKLKELAELRVLNAEMAAAILRHDAALPGLIEAVKKGQENLAAALKIAIQAERLEVGAQVAKIIHERLKPMVEAHGDLVEELAALPEFEAKNCLWERGMLREIPIPVAAFIVTEKIISERPPMVLRADPNIFKPQPERKLFDSQFIA